MSRVEITGVSKAFGAVQALRGVDLVIPPGHLVAVLGASGSGKTTLLRIIAGFERADAGTVAIDDVVATGPPERRRVGIVPQEGALFPHLDVGANVGFGIPRAGRTRRVGEMLELVGMAGYGRRRPHELSGGQQQRVALARALAPAPAVVLFDEPFTALDAGLRGELRTQVADLLRATGTTALLVTHDQSEALSMADQVAIMRDGVIVQSGTPSEVYTHPVDVRTARSVGEAVIVDGHGDGVTASTALGCIAAPGARGNLTVLLRPEQLVRDDSSPVRGRVRSIAFHGHDALVALDVDDVEVLARWRVADLPGPGHDVGLRLAGEATTYPATR